MARGWIRAYNVLQSAILLSLSITKLNVTTGNKSKVFRTPIASLKKYTSIGTLKPHAVPCDYYRAN